MEELSPIDKLDLVARAAANTIAVYGWRWWLVFVGLLTVFLASFSQASPYETAAVWMAAFLVVVTALLVWRKSPYSAFAVAILCFAFAIAGWFFRDPDDRTHLGSIVSSLGSAYFLVVGYGWLTSAMPLISAASKEFENERLLVTRWTETLRSSRQWVQIIEFSSKSFARGYWTYRLMNTGYCWMIARYKTGNMNRWLSYRVLSLEAVHVTDRPKEKLCIRLGNREVKEVDISADMRGRLRTSVIKGNWSEIDPLLP